MGRGPGGARETRCPNPGPRAPAGERGCLSTPPRMETGREAAGSAPRVITTLDAKGLGMPGWFGDAAGRERAGKAGMSED